MFITNSPENEQNSLAGLSESQASDQESLTEEANPQKDERSEEDGLRLSHDENSEGVEKGKEVSELAHATLPPRKEKRSKKKAAASRREIIVTGTGADFLNEVLVSADVYYTQGHVLTVVVVNVRSRRISQTRSAPLNSFP